MKNFKYPFSIIIIILLTSITGFCQKDSLKTNARTLPFAMHLIEDSNVDFPLPFGVPVQVVAVRSIWIDDMDDDE